MNIIQLIIHQWLITLIYLSIFYIDMHTYRVLDSYTCIPTCRLVGGVQSHQRWGEMPRPAASQRTSSAIPESSYHVASTVWTADVTAAAAARQKCCQMRTASLVASTDSRIAIRPRVAWWVPVTILRTHSSPISSLSLIIEVLEGRNYGMENYWRDEHPLSWSFHDYYYQGLGTVLEHGFQVFNPVGQHVHRRAGCKHYSGKLPSCSILISVCGQCTPSAYAVSVCRQRMRSAYAVSVRGQRTRSAYSVSIRGQRTRSAYAVSVSGQCTPSVYAVSVRRQCTPSVYAVSVRRQYTRSVYAVGLFFQQAKPIFTETSSIIARKLPSSSMMW